MVRTCMFCGAEKLGEDLTYHGFPLKAAEWLHNMGLGPNFVPSKNAMLCSNHFEKKCFQEGTAKGCLLPGSIPTIFGQYKASCVFCHARKGQDKNRSFRKFPLNNAELLQKWIAAMDVKDFVPNKRSVLCKTPAGEHNRNSQLPASQMETDPSLSPEEISASEGREKRRLSVDLPPPKISKTDTKYSMVNPMRASTSDSDKKQCQVDEVPSTSSASELANTLMQRNGQTPTTSRRIRHIVHDHQYETTPRSMRKKILLQKKRIQALMLEKHADKQHISRLKQQVTSLKQIVSELRRTRALSESGLECLNSTADTDVSQFLKRFIKNQRNIKKKQIFTSSI
ncbi:uncharacterized protein LOC143370260 isoform X3 [Andrena cerasifolii]|uniref:uncharacterized protein LOC143370260 isoform X3 n=1 Tax=Andrena cerasifolii TaxID=2819439 RepID=UPI0040379D85